MRFIHIADLHLGSSPEAEFLWGKNRAEEIWDSFAAVIDACNEKEKMCIRDRQKALLDWVKEGGTLVFEGSGGWTALQKMNISGFGSSKTFSAGSNQKLLYRSLGDGSVWFLGKTLSQTVSRLTDERKSQFIMTLSKGASGSYSEDFSSLSVYENSSLLYRLRTHKSSAETPKVWMYVAILILYLAVGIPEMCIRDSTRKAGVR